MENIENIDNLDFKQKLQIKYNKLVRLILDENHLDTEDLIRKYARDYCFWQFELKYYIEEQKQDYILDFITDNKVPNMYLPT